MTMLNYLLSTAVLVRIHKGQILNLIDKKQTIWTVRALENKTIKI